MNKKELAEILKKHKDWLNGNGGECADLQNANLQDADLQDADLRGADLDVEIPSTNDHYFISEILFREVENVNQKKIAGLVRISLDWCWEDFLKNCSKTDINWAKKILCNKWKEFEEKF